MSDPTVDTTVTPVADPTVVPEVPVVEAPVVAEVPAGTETITEVAPVEAPLDGATAVAPANEHSLGWTVQHVFREAETDAVALGEEAKADVEALVVEIKAAA